jgi:hypothetical protein
MACRRRLPVSATTRSDAQGVGLARMASTTLGELPLVEIASSTSCGWRPSAEHLLGEDIWSKRIVVGDRGQRRGVGGQRDGGEWRAFLLEAVEQFGGEVLGESAAEPPLPQAMILPPALQAGSHHLDRTAASIGRGDAPPCASCLVWALSVELLLEMREASRFMNRPEKDCGKEDSSKHQPASGE